VDKRFVSALSEFKRSSHLERPEVLNIALRRPEQKIYVAHRPAMQAHRSSP